MIKNLPTVKEQLITDLRETSEDRGLWYYSLLKTAREKGLNPEVFARQAIRKVGQSNRYKYPDTKDLRVFVEAFMDEVSRKLFEMELVHFDGQEARIEFHYCPMCGVWTKLTDDQKFLEQICDIAMEVDRGLFDTYDCFEFALGKTICSGNETCEIIIKKVKDE